MTLQKWIKHRAIHGYPTFSIEDVREARMYTSEQIMKNELNRLCSNKVIANVYRGFYVIIPVHYVLWIDNAQIEQDLIICRALVAIFSDEFLASQLAFRGGTAFISSIFHPSHVIVKTLIWFRLPPDLSSQSCTVWVKSLTGCQIE